MDIEITKGGNLVKIKWHYDPGEAEGRYVRSDITEDAPMYLFEHCTIEDGVTLKDIFLLIQKHLDFFSVVLNNWVEKFVVECLSGEGGENEIDYLEVYWHIEDDGAETFGNALPCFHGIQEEGNVAWCISASPLGKFVNLPVKLSSTLTVLSFLGKPGKYDISTYDNPRYTLGQILQAIVWELSYYGPPAKRDATWDMIRKDMENVIEKMDTLD